MLTDEQLAEIRARADGATAGPWLTIQPGGPNGPFWAICNSQGNVIALRLSQSSRDATFIAHARADIPALLAELDEWRTAAKLAADEDATSGEQHCACVPLLRAENERLRELCHKTLRTLLRAGDALNWPDDVEEAITELRKTLGR